MSWILEGGVIYQEYWSLKQNPFENTNDFSFFFFSPTHKEALARIQYAVSQRKSGMLLTGNCGIGKTFLLYAFIHKSFEYKCVVSFIPHLRLSIIELIKELAAQLGVKMEMASPTKLDFIHAIRDKFREHHDKNIHSVIVVDEAQSIADDTLLEEIRLLLNIQGADSLLFTLILSGDLELEERISCAPHLKQRLALRFRIQPFTLKETQEYVDYRLIVAGNTRKIFTDSAYQQIYSFSEGVPRIINNVCDFALFTAFANNVKMIDRDIINKVINDLGESSQEAGFKGGL